MGYAAEGSLEELFPDVVEPVARETARRTRAMMKAEVRKRTPVAEMPVAYSVQGGGGNRSWIRDRKGRTPGTLRDSWEETPLEVAPGPVHRTGVETNDPIGRFVEDDTRPHEIRPRKPLRVDPVTGKTTGGVLRFPQGSRFVFRPKVDHPGTQGVHMMRDTMAEVAVRWPAIFDEVFDEVAYRAERGLPLTSPTDTVERELRYRDVA